MQIEDVGRIPKGREDPPERNNPLSTCSGNPWRAPANEAAKSQTRLEWLSTHADRQTEAGEQLSGRRDGGRPQGAGAPWSPEGRLTEEKAGRAVNESGSKCSSSKPRAQGTVRARQGSGRLCARTRRRAPGRSGARCRSWPPGGLHGERVERLSGQKKMFFRQSPVLIFGTDQSKLGHLLHERVHCESDDCLEQTRKQTKERKPHHQGCGSAAVASNAQDTTAHR